MTTLTITAKGQVTLKRDVLRHLGIGPGDRVEVELLPGGRVRIEREPPRTSWREIYGRLKGAPSAHEEQSDEDAAIGRLLAEEQSRISREWASHRTHAGHS